VSFCVFVYTYIYIERRRGVRVIIYVQFLLIETHLRRKDIQAKRPDIGLKCNMEVTFGTQVN